MLSLAGTAVGLGNAWKFPTMVAAGGGGAFLILFLVFSFIISVPLFIFEMALGKHARTDIAEGFAANAAHFASPVATACAQKIARAGGISMFSGVFVLSFYLIILSWVLAFIPAVFTLGAAPTAEAAAAAAAAYFAQLESGSLATALGFYLPCFAMVIFTLARGVIAGIERLNCLLMPLLFALLIALFVYAAAAGDFAAAARFVFVPDFSNIGVAQVLDALGLALFMMCLGVGCIYTFSCSAAPSANLLRSASFVVFINLLTGVMMALVVFSFTKSGSGAGLVFISLFGALAALGIAGKIVLALFFIALFFAGLTSAVSMIEPFIFYLSRRLQSRAKALVAAAVLVFCISLVCMLGMHGALAIDGFGALDFLTSNILLPAGVLFLCVYGGFLMRASTRARLFLPLFGRRGYLLYLFILRVLAPAAIAAVAIKQFF